ncbi:AIG2 family protein [Klebsiella pneumoniae]|uniref:AIG2 family protein n=14 Tax=Klebsiella pneumoniae TaxID=573 RepID=A0A377TZV5_KLEPN|nr:AIG2 family protein [Klebsiella pneumoniae]
MPGGVPPPHPAIARRCITRILVSRSAVGGYQGERERENEPLFVYGTLCPGRSNAHILEAIGGEWRPGYVTGTFYARGWGAAADFPGIVLDAHGPRVNGYLFLSDRLAAHWPMLDDFEEGYDRVPVEVTTDDGQQISAWIYQLQPRG